MNKQSWTLVIKRIVIVSLVVGIIILIWATTPYFVDIPDPPSPYESPPDGPPQTTITENDDNYIFHHEWDYKGSRWTYEFQIPRSSYEYFSNKVRISDYGEYVDNPADDNWMSQLANRFREAAEKKGWGAFETVGFVLAFVQGLPYTSDQVTTGYDDYPRYPIETIVDGGGDCEDTSILFSSIVRGMPYGTVLLYLREENHMAVGVSISQSVVDTWNQDYPLCRYTYDNKIYAYCETAGDGWQLGHKPDEIIGRANIIFV